jgi:ComF family protein
VIPVVSFALEALVALLAPPRCASCDASVRLVAAFCPACAGTAVRLQAGPGPPAAAFVYGGAVARAIVRMKYESRPDLARPLGDLLWRALRPHARSLRGVVVVPVPLHVTRLVERGFNQSALLAGRLAAHAGYLEATFQPGALARTKATRQQAALDRPARVTNVAGAFRVRQPAALRGRTVLLVDDVTTTGATFDACEEALAGAGAADVHRIAVASAPQRVEEADKERQALRRPWGYHGAHP